MIPANAIEDALDQADVRLVGAFARPAARRDHAAAGVDFPSHGEPAAKLRKPVR